MLLSCDKQRSPALAGSRSGTLVGDKRCQIDPLPNRQLLLSMLSLEILVSPGNCCVDVPPMKLLQQTRCLLQPPPPETCLASPLHSIVGFASSLYFVKRLSPVCVDPTAAQQSVPEQQSCYVATLYTFVIAVIGTATMQHSSGSLGLGRQWWLQPASLLLLLCWGLAGSAAQAVGNEDVHVVFLTDCTSYSDWQTLGMVFSWKESGQVGGTTDTGLTGVAAGTRAAEPELIGDKG